MPDLAHPVLDAAALARTDRPVLDVPVLGARLRPWELADAPVVRAAYADEAIRRWHCRSLDSDDEARELIGRWRDGWATGRAEWAVEVASAWAFGVGYHRLQLVHSTRNAASCRAAAKSGFEIEATLRELVQHADGWHDMCLHSRFA